MSVADHEARASESEQRPQKKKGVVTLGEEPGKQDNCEAQKQKRENRPAAVLVRPDAERDADGGREKGLHRSQDEHLSGAERVPLDQKGGERGKHSPNRKTEGKRQERYPQNPGVARRIGHHIINLDNWIFHGFLPTKRYIYLLGILIAGSPRLRQRIRLRFLLLIVTGEQRPQWRRRCGHIPRHGVLRAHRSTHRTRPAGPGDPCAAWPSTRFQPRPQETHLSHR